ncbi:MAG TPA: BPSL0067 family protein [Cellvibrionaceae bacterium]|nr:BPSL0067 family protein [Cellvibrionaceae bacterium]
MTYIYSSVEDLHGMPKVGTKHCVALVQHYAKAPVTGLWKEGAVVLGTSTLKKGTVIATFVNGKYANLPQGNHAALYISQDSGGIWVMDQWKDDVKKPTISKRYIRKLGQNADGSYLDPSNNAGAYRVVE